MKRAQAPLAGVRIVEFCSVAAGPYCAMLLADMGAEVIKVEPKQGDALRQWPPISNGVSENFASLNRNKQSIALDLKDPEERDIAKRLIESADVVVENNRPGAMERLGLDYKVFADGFPELIYCSISAFGQDGPRAQGGGFDLTIQAMSGIMSVTGEADGGPVKCGMPISDFSTGLYGAFAIASLIARVKAGGKGGHIDISMLGASLAVSALQTSEYFGSGKDPQRLGTAHPRNAPYQAFQAADGNYVLAAGNDKLWKSVCRVIGRPELYDDARFLTTSDRARHQAEIAHIMNNFSRDKTVEQLLLAFEAANVPCAPINSYSSALADPQVTHMGWVQALELSNGHKTRTFGSPVRLDGQSLAIAKAPPALDEDRNAILAGLGVFQGLMSTAGM